MPGPSACPSCQSQGCGEIKREVPWVNLMHTFAGKTAAATGAPLSWPGGKPRASSDYISGVLAPPMLGKWARS